MAIPALAAAMLASAAAAAKTVAPPPPFQPWLTELRSDEEKRCVGAATLYAALGGVQPIPRVIELDRRQPEFTLTLGSYFKKAISEKRIAIGREMLKKHAALLRRVSKKYGVQPRFLVAFWGLESNFGQYTGVFPVVGALVTLAHDRRRARFFREQLLAVLQLIDGGHFPTSVKGSWAGAMGNHQFIPTTYRDFAVDFDGDGKRDLWNSLPDIFASAAHYLSRSGWDKDRTWGREIRIPKGFDIALAGTDTRKSLAEWQSLGIRRADGGSLPKVDVEASVMLPAGYRGPAFLVYRNYRTILVWNRSHLYALAVGHLADRLAGQGPLVAKLADDGPLSRQNILEMQRLLARLGFDPGVPDGRVGPKTRKAIKAYQIDATLPPDAYPTKALIRHMRARAK
ncbi:MAG: lytic murein transglycosylase [Magnetovibrio sp.]|nr:lytic murein transglycosylase [Magnetovibrio sp.]